MYVMIIAVCVFINFLLLKYKIEDGRWMDAVIDVSAMVILGYLFGGTMTGMAIAMAGGVLISIWLLFFPPAIMTLEA